MVETPEIDSEARLQEWLQAYFERNNWTAIREVNVVGESYSADLIVNHQKYGWFGIEAKYFQGDGGAKMADAHHQITRKYRGEKYINTRIDLWAVCPYFADADCSDFKQMQETTRLRLMREFFSRHGIGFLDLQRKGMVIDFAYSNKSMKVPIAGDSKGLEKYRDAVDMELIQESVSRKRQVYDYK